LLGNRQRGRERRVRRKINDVEGLMAPAVPAI
jgi:hypothetical protein